MEGCEVAIKKAAISLYSNYIKKGLEEEIAFKGVGMQYIRFAIQEPKLFQLLFMTEQANKPTTATVLSVIDENYSDILLSAERCYGICEDEAEKLYRHLWIYSHGIAVLCATNMCTFTPEEIGELLTEMRVAVLNEIKGGKSQ